MSVTVGRPYPLHAGSSSKAILAALPDQELDEYLRQGTGVGRALIDALMRWFATRQLDTAFLHYLADNPLSSRFWTSAGFVPHLEIYSDVAPDR